MIVPDEFKCGHHGGSTQPIRDDFSAVHVTIDPWRILDNHYNYGIPFITGH